MQLVLISGMSGSGKSVALNVLEDAGYFCVDNLPALLLASLVEQLKHENHERVAVAVDMRSGASIAVIGQGVEVARRVGRVLGGGHGRHGSSIHFSTV